MAIEIERRYLVDHLPDLSDCHVSAIRQGYFVTGGGAEIRIRIADASAWLTIKSEGSRLVRSEFDYPIPLEDAQSMLDQFCSGRQLAKSRTTLQVAGKEWTIDVFEGVLKGLVLAEVELHSAEEAIAVPGWAGREITGEARFGNGKLISSTFQELGPWL